MKRHENLEEAMCRELDLLDKKYGSGEKVEMDPKDLERADILFHALKSAEGYYTMKEANEWEDEESGGRGRSYARKRDRMGRYMSGRYDYGYSGHYPPMMPYEREDWRY